MLQGSGHIPPAGSAAAMFCPCDQWWRMHSVQVVYCCRLNRDSGHQGSLAYCWLQNRHDLRLSGRILLDATSSLSPYRPLP